MDNDSRPPGKTTVAPEVLAEIARKATLKVKGVSTMAPNVKRLFRRGLGVADGVKIAVEADIVYVDLYVIFENNVNIRNISRTVQQKVTRAITEMVGMDVAEVNIHIENIAYEDEEEA
ncbi:MAG TPA: Asp23/Gls24 family envelope stress response protein [Anaerolineales bacterium]|nr:Asp23/Gls24 family envelope stress response protein [Anaerolineales bacterium]